MFELGIAAFTGVIATGLLIAFKKLRSMQNRFDQLARDYDILANPQGRSPGSAGEAAEV